MSKNISKKFLLSVISIGVMSFCGVLVETAMNVTFPTLMKDFSVSTSMVQWVTTIYLLFISIVVPISPFLKKKFSNKKLFIIANTLFIIGIILDIFGMNFSILLLGRAVQGIATGIALPLMFNIIIEQAPKEKLGLIMGVGTLTTSIAPAIGPTFGGIVSTYLSWRYIYIFLIPILVLSFIIGIFTIEQKDKTQKVSLDVLGFIYIALTFTGLIYGMSVIGENGFNIICFISFLLGIISCIFFIIRMNNSPEPIINLSVFKNKKFNYLLLSFLIYQSMLLGFSFIIPNFIQIVNKETASVAGLVMTPGAIIAAFLSPLSGKLLDKIGPKIPILAGTIIATIFSFILTLSLSNGTTMFIGFIQFLFMLGLGLAYSNIVTTATKLLKEKEKVDGIAVLNTLQQFIGAIATSIVASIISFVQNSNSDISYEELTVRGFKYAAFYLCILMIINLISIFLCFKKNTRSLQKKL